MLQHRKQIIATDDRCLQTLAVDPTDGPGLHGANYTPTIPYWEVLGDYILRGFGLGNRLTVGMVVNPRGSACGIVAAAAAFFSCWILRRAALPSSSSLRVCKACRRSSDALAMVLSITQRVGSVWPVLPRLESCPNQRLLVPVSRCQRYLT